MMKKLSRFSAAVAVLLALGGCAAEVGVDSPESGDEEPAPPAGPEATRAASCTFTEARSGAEVDACTLAVEEPECGTSRCSAGACVPDYFPASARCGAGLTGLCDGAGHCVLPQVQRHRQAPPGR